MSSITWQLPSVSNYIVSLNIVLIYQISYLVKLYIIDSSQHFASGLAATAAGVVVVIIIIITIIIITGRSVGAKSIGR